MSRSSRWEMRRHHATGLRLKWINSHVLSSKTNGKTHQRSCLFLIEPEALWMIVITFLPFNSHTSRKMSAVSAVNGLTPGWPHPRFDDEHLKEVIVGGSMGCLQFYSKGEKERQKKEGATNVKKHSSLWSFHVSHFVVFPFKSSDSLCIHQDPGLKSWGGASKGFLH